jgi:hypothetical protein
MQDDIDSMRVNHAIAMSGAWLRKHVVGGVPRKADAVLASRNLAIPGLRNSLLAFHTGLLDYEDHTLALPSRPD